MSEVVAPRLPPPRTLILLALWGLIVFWTAISAVANLNDMMASPAAGFRASSSYPAVLFALDFWALIASLIVGLLAFNPFGWLNGKRLIFGCMAFAVMLGRLLGGWFTYLVLFTPLPPSIIILTMPIVLLVCGVVAIGMIAFVVATIFAFVVGVPVMLFNQILQFDLALTRYRFHERGLANYIVRAVYWLRNEPLPAGPPDESKGARFATDTEARAIHEAASQHPARMGFGHWIEHEQAPFFVQTDKHVLIMASTRSGKGVSLIIPHLLRYQGSAFVLDPKGENAKATGRQRARLNDKVHYLDPFGVSGKPQSRFNPLARFTPDNMEAESKALAAAMFVVEERQRDHWTASGQQLLAALILYVYLAPDIPKDHKDLPTVRKVLLGGIKDALKAMMEIDDADGLLRDLAVSFLETPDKEFGSIVSTAQRQTEILDNPSMIACLSARGEAPEVDFKDWHTGTMSVFLCLAAPKFPTFNRWLRLVLTSALDEMTDKLNPPALPVCFMLDELATLGHLQTVENAIGLAAGYGIQLVSVFQDVAQMRGLYKARWASFIGNAGVRALFNLDDFDTADYWSKFIGGRIFEQSSRQEDKFGLSNGRNVGETVRQLLPSDQLMMDFASGRMLVLVQGARPLVTKRVAYFDDRGLVSTWDDPRLPAAPPKPKQPSPPPKSPWGAPSVSAPPPPHTAAQSDGARPATWTYTPNFTVPGMKPTPNPAAAKPRPNAPDGNAR